MLCIVAAMFRFLEMKQMSSILYEFLDIMDKNPEMVRNHFTKKPDFLKAYIEPLLEPTNKGRKREKLRYDGRLEYTLFCTYEFGPVCVVLNRYSRRKTRRIGSDERSGSSRPRIRRRHLLRPVVRRH